MLRFIAVLCLVALSAAAKDRELNGVKMPDTITVDGKTLTLNGQGQRTKFVFKVYVAGLYLEQPSNDPAAILAADQARRVDMHMQRDLEKKKIVEALQSGFEANNKEKLAGLKDRLEKFTAVIPDLKEGQVLSLVYVPGKGTTVKGNDGAEFTAEGKDFADALWSVWLGKSPVDEDLKKGMLGK